MEKKEAFSDGVSSKENSWYEIIQNHVNELITDEEFQKNSKYYIHNQPKIKESYYYRKIFDKFYPNRDHTIPYYWLPKWCGDIIDPSARVLSVYNT